MDNSLRSFGPNGNGTWSSNNVGLGQREMHFTPEDQYLRLPLKSRDGQRVLVCDARIDNRPELSRILAIPPTDTREMSDAAFIMLAYEKWGIDCVKHLIGDLAFALWDQRERRLLLARSPVGGRPLYYYSSPDFFAFSTMPQGLFALSGIPRELNRNYLAGYLTRTGTEPHQTFFSTIYKLIPGQLLTVNPAGLHQYMFWQPDAHNELRFADDQQYVEAFNELFERIVGDHLRSRTPVGVMMSGGLDSSSVAALAASQLKTTGQRLTTFTEVPRAGFDGVVRQGRYADETPFVHAMSQLYDNIDAQLVRTDGLMYLDNLERLFEKTCLPFRNASNRIWYETILQEASNRGIRVLLTGAQGNLTISRNGNSYLPQLIRSGRWSTALHEASALHRHHNTSSVARTLLSQGILPLLPRSLWIALQILRGKLHLTSLNEPWLDNSPVKPDFATRHKISESVRLKGVSLFSQPDANQHIIMRKLIPRMTALSNELNQGYSALYGIEMRDPTADVRIVEFCLSLPEDQYFKNGISRRLIRRAMAGKLPLEILENKKRGLQAADWRERLYLSKSQITAALDDWNHCPVVTSILDLERIRDLVDKLPQTDVKTSQMTGDCRTLLDSALMTGMFIRWFEKSGVHNV